MVAALVRAGCRVFALLIWYLFILLSLHLIVPYVINLAEAGVGAGSLPLLIGYEALGVAVAAAALHLHLILLRLICLRTRLFG